ncbi:MAG: SdpI family protein [Candidatus Bilamarchaeaceae archaeon]
MKAMNAITILLIVASFAAGAYFYPSMPNFMASHWNGEGKADGYMEKEIALFLLPAATLAIAGFLYLVPKIDPLRENIEKFRRQYDGFIFLFVLFLTYVYFLQIAWSLGISFDMNRMMVPGLGVLFIYIGMLCGDCRQNWFVGVRTPWTMSSERVWKKTHSLAEKLFLGIGALWIVVGLVFPGFSPFMIAAAILAAISLFAYSYFEFQNEKKEKENAMERIGEARVEPDYPLPAKKKPVPLKKKPSVGPKKPRKPKKPEAKAREKKGRTAWKTK